MLVILKLFCRTGLLLCLCLGSHTLLASDTGWPIQLWQPGTHEVVKRQQWSALTSTELTGRPAPQLESIPTSQFPTPAKRQTNSRLQLDRLHQQFGIQMPRWQQALEPVVAEALSESPDAN